MLATNPELYKKLYPEDFGGPKAMEPKMEEDGTIIPRSQEELKKIYEEFRSDGVVSDLRKSGINVNNEVFDLNRTYDNIARQMKEKSGNQDIDSLLKSALEGPPGGRSRGMRILES